MTFLVERLSELRRHVDHLDTLAPRVADRRPLETDLSLHDDVLFSLLMIAQLVIDIAGELAARQGRRLEDYAGAIRALGADARFPPDLLRRLERAASFRRPARAVPTLVGRTSWKSVIRAARQPLR